MFLFALSFSCRLVYVMSEEEQKSSSDGEGEEVRNHHHHHEEEGVVVVLAKKTKEEEEERKKQNEEEEVKRTTNVSSIPPTTIPQKKPSNHLHFHLPPYTLDEEIAYAWATQPFSPRTGVDAVFECWMQCENGECLKWRRIPRIVGKVLEQGRAAVETQLVKDAGKGMIARTCEDEGNEDARTRTTTNTTTETTNASNNKREIWTCKDVVDARYDSCEKPQELSDDDIDRLMADADEAAEKEVRKQMNSKAMKEEEKKKRAYEYNKRKRDEANELKIQAGTHERLPSGHVRKITERKEKVVKEPRVKKEKVSTVKVQKEKRGTLKYLLEQAVEGELYVPPRLPNKFTTEWTFVKCEIASCGKRRRVKANEAVGLGTRDRWVCPLGEYGGLRQFASCDAEEEFTSEEIEQYMKTQTEALEQEKQLKNLFREFCERNPKYVVDGSYTTRDGKVVVDGAKKAVKITAPTVTHIVPPSAVAMAAVAAATTTTTMTTSNPSEASTQTTENRKNLSASKSSKGGQGELIIACMAFKKGDITGEQFLNIAAQSPFGALRACFYVLFGVETSSNNKEWIFNTLAKRTKDASFMPTTRPRYNNASRQSNAGSSIQDETKAKKTIDEKIKKMVGKSTFNGESDKRGCLRNGASSQSVKLEVEVKEDESGVKVILTHAEEKETEGVVEKVKMAVNVKKEDDSSERGNEVVEKEMTKKKVHGRGGDIDRQEQAKSALNVLIDEESPEEDPSVWPGAPHPRVLPEPFDADAQLLATITKIPPTIRVTCNEHDGVYLVRRKMFRCMCEQHECLKVSGEGDGNVFGGAEWEKHCGKGSSKTWKRSVRIVKPEGKKEMIGNWLHRTGLQPMPSLSTRDDHLDVNVGVGGLKKRKTVSGGTKKQQIQQIMMEALQDPDSNENCVSFNGLSLKDLMRAFNFIFDDAHKDDEEKKQFIVPVPETFDASLVGRCVEVFWAEENAYFPGVISRYIPTSEAEDANANAIFEITYDDGDVEKLKNFQSEKVIWFSNEYVPKKRLTAEEAYIESEKNLGRFACVSKAWRVAALTVLKARGSRSLEDAKKEQIASRQQVGFVQDYVHRADVREVASERQCEPIRGHVSLNSCFAADAEEDGGQIIDADPCDKGIAKEWYPCVGERNPRLKSGRDVREQETYGCDFVTGRDAVAVLAEALPEFSDDEHWGIYAKLMNQVNESYGKMTPDTLATQSLALAAEDLAEKFERANITSPKDGMKNLACAKALWTFSKKARENPNLFVVHRKGYGVVNIREKNIQKGEFVVDFLGEIYPPWAWMEKQDAIKQAQKAKGLKDIGAPEFYNMQMERPGGDKHGFGLLFCDAMHYNNFAARMSHSCEPNVQVILTVVDGKYEIHFYATREIQKGEELCYNYHSCSDSMKEVEAAFCLCGAKKCRGSYLSFVGENNNSQVFDSEHRILDRYAMLLDAIDEAKEKREGNDDNDEVVKTRLESLGFRIGCGILADAPKWLTNYYAKVASFIDHERETLPPLIYEAAKEHHINRRKRGDPGYRGEFVYTEKNAEIEAMAVRENRIQALAVCMSKIRRLLTLGEGFDSPKYGTSPPPYAKLSAKETIEKFWCNKIVTAPPNVAPAADSDDPTTTATTTASPPTTTIVKAISPVNGGAGKKRKGRGRWSKGAKKEENGTVNGGVESNAPKDKPHENAPSVALFLSQTIAQHSRRKTLSHAQREKYLSFLSSLEFKSKEMMDLVPAAGDEETNEDDDDNESRLLSKNRAALLWLRDALLDLPVTPCARHDLCADIVHLFANTEHFYKFDHLAPCYQTQAGIQIDVREDEVMAFGVGAQAASHKIASSHSKKYKYDYIPAALLSWHKQELADPTKLVHVSFKGCAYLPDISCCYGVRAEAKPIVNGCDLENRSKWLSCLTEKINEPWEPKTGPWAGTNAQKLIGSPMLDAWRKKQSMLDESALDWLRTRKATDVSLQHVLQNAQSVGYQKNYNNNPALYESGRLQQVERALAAPMNFASNGDDEEQGHLSKKAKQELASLAPWSFDPKVKMHPPGPKSMKDFSEVAKNGGGHNNENMDVDEAHVAVVEIAKKNVFEKMAR